MLLELSVITVPGGGSYVSSPERSSPESSALDILWGIVSFFFLCLLPGTGPRFLGVGFVLTLEFDDSFA